MSLAEGLPPSPLSPTTRTRSPAPKAPLNLPQSLPPTSTPEDSTASGHDGSSLGSRKRVGFHPFTNVHDSSSDRDTSSQQRLEVKPLPPSRDCHSSNRPILKVRAPGEQVVDEIDVPVHAPASLNEAMESIFPQLNSDDKRALIEAYQALASAMRAYDELSDPAAMKLKLNTLSKHIRAHLNMCEEPGQNVVDSSLFTSILKVAVILVWSPDMSPLLHDKFRCFLLDSAIQAVVDHKAPKNVVMHYLHLLATQNFKDALLRYSERSSRLIKALGTLCEHYKGNGPASERLMVYTKLIDQDPWEMKRRAHSWIEPMLQGMCSAVPALRTKALELGRKAYQAYPRTNSICSEMRQALRPAEQAPDRHNSVPRRLEKLIDNRDSETALVPQIWAVVLLLVNHPVHPIEKWPQFKAWLVVIQRCFNGSDPALRQQAYLAWNRFVFIAQPHLASTSMLEMLLRPVVARLERAGALPKKGGLEVAVSTYCNLLYYTFRPATSHHYYSKGWQEHVTNGLHDSLFERCPAYTDAVSRILMALLWDARTTTKVWNENRAHEIRLVEPEELPTIDCKWVRKNCQLVLATFRKLFRYSSWGLVGSSDQAFVSKAWRHLLRAIRDAGSKEIKLTKDMRSAIVAITELIAEVDVDSQSWPAEMSSHGLQTLIRLTVSELGPDLILEVLGQSPHWQHFQLLRQILTRVSEGEVLGRAATAEDDLGTPLKKCLKIIDSSLVPRDDEASASVGLTRQANALCQVLASLPRQSMLPCLRLLSPCLSSWLRDGAKFLPGTEALDDVSTHVLENLETVSPSCVAELDDVFAAALSSTHSPTVKAMTALWRRHFGPAPDLNTGPLLQQAVLQMRQDMDVDHPLATDDGDEDEAAASAAVEEVEALPIDATVDESNDIPTVESPPKAPGDELQLVGERADGLSERPQSEPAIVFADVRSSPRPRSCRSQSRDCEFARKAASMWERPATPTFPDAHDAREVEAVPSPTPRARRMHAIEEADIPSSPPSMQGGNMDRGIAVYERSATPPQEASEFAHQLFLDSPAEEEDDAVVASADEQTETNADLVVDEHDDDNNRVTEEAKEATSEGTVLAGRGQDRAETPSRQSSSDELEDLSASQLSRDLEYSQAMEAQGEEASEGLDGEKRIASEEAKEEPPSDETGALGTRRNLRKRKRAAAGSEDKGRRRRRRRTSSREQSSLPPKGDDADSEIYDEIVALSSPSGATSPAPTGHGSSHSHELSGRRQSWTITLPQSRVVVDQGSPEDAEVAAEDGEDKEDAEKMDLISALRQSLDLVKSAARGSFDLRAVADLCFEIQHMATLRAASG